MKKPRKILPLLLTMLLFAALLPATASANAAEPPGLTVLVCRPPEGLALFLRFPDGEEIALREERKGWEGYYRYFYHMSGRGMSSLDGAELLARWAGNERAAMLSASAFGHYNNMVTMSLPSGTVSEGQPAWRVPALVALRVGLTLLLEGLIFFAFGYRIPRSWGIFLATNLVTQGLLNTSITGPRIGGYWIYGFVFGEILIFAAETLAYCTLLREHGRRRAAACAVCANAVSLFLGGALIARLPI